MKNAGENEYLVECVGCAIGRGEMIPPGGMIKETKNFVLHQDPAIPIPGFLIVASKVHAQSLVQFDRNIRHEMIDLLHEAVTAVKESGITERVTVLQEERSQHFHVWVFPYLPWMDRYFTSPISEYRDVMKAVLDAPEVSEGAQNVPDTVAMIRNLINRV